MNNITFGRVIAHRGASAHAPENTLAAFRKAKELGAQWVECDVRLTRDGEAVIFHDSRLHRTTNGKGWVRWKRYADLMSLDAGEGERIIRLEELLDCLDSLALSLHLEIKPSFGRVHHTTRKVMHILNQYELKNTEICISSFSPKSLHTVRALHSFIHLGLSMDRWRKNWQKVADQLSCVSVHCSKKILTPDRVLEIKNTGRQVLAYTVNDRAEAEKLYQMGVDTVFSDYSNLLSLPITA